MRWIFSLGEKENRKELVLVSGESVAFAHICVAKTIKNIVTDFIVRCHWHWVIKTSGSQSIHQDIIPLLHKLLSCDHVLWYINLHGLFNAKAILVVGQKWYYLTQCWGGIKELAQSAEAVKYTDCTSAKR